MRLHELRHGAGGLSVGAGVHAAPPRDAVELARLVGEDGWIGHAGSRIGDATVMGFDAKPDWP